MKTKEIYIEGMHCNSCVVLLQEEFAKLENVKDVKVDLQTSSALLSYENNEPSIEALKQTASAYGYKILNEKPAPQKELTQKSLNPWISGFLIAGFIIIIFLYLQKSGLIEKFGPSSNVPSVGMALLLGVIASLSTCFAVVGSIVIAFGSLYGAGSEQKPLFQAMRANILFHAGRLSSFFVLGGLLGWFGGKLSLSGQSLGVYMVIYALLMILMALQIFGINKITAKLGWKMPAPLFKIISRLKNSKNPVAPVVLGAVTFFLPCGFTQSMQIIALGSGSFLTGGLLLLLFALGTLPILFWVYSGISG